MFYLIITAALLQFSALFAKNVDLINNGIVPQGYIHGHCGRCGWPLDENGTCTNQNCNQYGPKTR